MAFKASDTNGSSLRGVEELETTCGHKSKEHDIVDRLEERGVARERGWQLSLTRQERPTINQTNIGTV